MNRNRLAVVGTLGICLMLCLGRADAAVYVVDFQNPQASDANAGTEQAPWKTIQHAADAAQAGDTVLVLPGVYGGNIRPAASGEPGRPIVFRGVADGFGPEGAVVIEGGEAGVDLRDRQFIRLEGFEIRGTEGPRGNGVEMDSGKNLEVIGNHIHHTAGNGVLIQVASDCLIRDNYIHHIGGTGVHAGGLTYRVERVQIVRNHIHDNGVEDGIQIGAGDDCLMAYNYIHDIWAPPPSHTDGIQLHSGNRNYRVIGNVCHRIRAEGFMIGGGGRDEASAPTLEGNIMSDGGGVSFIVSGGAGKSTWLHNTVLWGRWQSLWIHNGATGATVIGNLFQSPDGGCVVTQDSMEGLTVDYNLAAGSQGIVGPHGRQGDPMLVDPKQPGAPTLPNARLRPGSPAIDAGPDDTDIGALEYPNVYYVDPQHPAATDEFYGYRALPFKTLARACEAVRPGETIVLCQGVYRETLAPQCDDITVRGMEGEKAVISGADIVSGWRREEAGWSAALDQEPKVLLRDGQKWTEFSYDPAARRLRINAGGDPRLHLFETVVRRNALDLSGKANVRLEGLETANLLPGG